jgi:beta-lactamase regulating signal transducer with metallopeptidase domain
MTSEVLVLLGRLNLVAGGAILLVLALRPFVRRWLGASVVYRLWFTVPIALLAAIMPPPDTWGPVGPVERLTNDADGWLSAGGNLDAVLAVWGAGALLTVGLTAWRYARFMREARKGRAGPAIVGVLTPRLITPADFRHRYTPEERRLVRAHERAHMDRLDARCNALVLALQCLNWFNPLIHVAARALRFDQELACDATVIHRLPTDRRRYAEALLRSHAEAAPVLGCSWSGAGARLLMTRLTTLMGRRPGESRLELGDVLMAVLWMLVVCAAWSAQPPYRLADPGSQRAIYLSLDTPGLPGVALPAVSR